MSHGPKRALVGAGLAYFAIGMGSAVISNPVGARGLQAMMRLTALALGMVVFVVHVRHEATRWRHSVRAAAAWSAGGVAVGAFLLGVHMVLYNVLVRSRPALPSAPVLVVWPLVTSALAFPAAMIVAKYFAGRAAGHKGP